MSMYSVGSGWYVGYKMVEPTQGPGGMEEGEKGTPHEVRLLQRPQCTSEDGEPSVNGREL